MIMKKGIKRSLMLLFMIVFLLTLGAPFASAAETGTTTPVDRAQLPEPVYYEKNYLVDLYWFAWEKAWDHVHYDPGAPQSPFMDEAFSDGNIWIWDTCFMTLFCRYAHDLFPGVQSLLNFYAPMHDGVSTTQYIWHQDNPPLFAWVEWENYKFTGDKTRLTWLLQTKQYLQKHYTWFENQRRYSADGYTWTGVSSGMDNTPRGRDSGGYSGILWVDAMAQQALVANLITKLANEIGDTAIKNEYTTKYNDLKNKLNTIYWDSADGCYYDIRKSSPSIKDKVKTPASYWPMLAEVTDSTQAGLLKNLATDPNIFAGLVSFPTVARNDRDFNPSGQYWRGSVWLPTGYMAIKALENYGYLTEADEAARKIVDHQYNTFINKSWKPHTIWECYNPTEAKWATTGDGSSSVRPDFCGWSALGPISLLIENYLGFHKVDAAGKRVEWRKYLTGRHGIKRLHFGSITTDIIGDGGYLYVKSNGAYTLVVNGTPYNIVSGEQSWGTEPSYSSTRLLYEAECASVSGCNVNSNHTGYTGGGFVDEFKDAGDYVKFYVDAPDAGNYSATLRYANAMGGARTASLYVNDSKIKQISLPNLADWETWGGANESVALNAGSNTITYKLDTGDNGNINLDFMEIASSGAATPTPMPTSTPPANKALLATASATSVNPSFPASRVNDGNLGTGGDYVSADNPTLPQYVTLVWSAGQTFDRVDLKSWYCQGQAPTSWDIEVSTDGSTSWTNVASSGTVSWTKNDATVEAKSVSFTQVTNKKGMRVKINGANLSWGHFAVVEIEVYGQGNSSTATPTPTPTATPTPAMTPTPTPSVSPTPTPGGTNIARTATASATSVNPSYPASRVNDGIIGSNGDYMSANNPTIPQYVTLLWSAGQSFSRVDLKSWYCQGQAPTSWNIEVSTDGSTGWTNVASSGTVSWTKNDATVETKPVSFTQVTGKKGVRVKINSANLSWSHFAILEIEVY